MQSVWFYTEPFFETSSATQSVLLLLESWHCNHIQHVFHPSEKAPHHTKNPLSMQSVWFYTEPFFKIGSVQQQKWFFA